MEIIDLIPQREPIVMVDKFVGITNGISETQLTIKNDNIFVENDCFTEFGLIEHIAQSAAARVGYICRNENKPISIGYIGAISNMEIVFLPKINDMLETKIEILQEVFNITLVKAESFTDGRLAASCQMKILIISW